MNTLNDNDNNNDNVQVGPQGADNNTIPPPGNDTDTIPLTFIDVSDNETITPETMWKQYLDKRTARRAARAVKASRKTQTEVEKERARVKARARRERQKALFAANPAAHERYLERQRERTTKRAQRLAEIMKLYAESQQ